MKKSLVLAMAMALGVTASAYAANPFSDVPAGHWAYDSIDKLAAAGVIEGMGDGTYQGDKTMTRYEMAQIVAKAMAKGANVDKLAAEFADELDNLGVRVANLEKKADNVKITGNIRYNYASQHARGGSDKNAGKLRSRLWITGQINENWSYTGMLENIQNFDGDNKGKGEETTDFQRAVVKGRIGGLKVRAGRDQFDDIAGYMHASPIYSTRADLLEVSYGKKVNVTAGIAQASNANTNVAASKGKNMYYATVKANVAQGADVHAGYYKINDSYLGRGLNADKDKILAEGENNGIFTIGFNAPVAKKTVLSANYMKSDVKKIGAESIDHDGYNVELTYGSLKKPGDWNLTVGYMDLAHAVSPAHGNNAFVTPSSFKNGSKGLTYSANYLAAKNITANVEYYDMKSKDDGDKTQTLWTALIFKF